MKFEFYAPGKIVFRSGAFDALSDFVSVYGNKAFAVCAQSAVKNGLLERLQKQNTAIEYTVFDKVCAEPSPKSVDSAAELARKSGCRCVIGIGGGSAIDTAKAVAGLAVNAGGVEDYLEGVGKGAKIVNSPLPFIAVPTTSGTGAEATKNAVISSAEKKYKKSFRSEKLLPAVALIDPLLTVTAPKNITAACGMDAVTQLIESYTSIKSNPITEALCLKGLAMAPELLKAYENGDDLHAREAMSLCSLLSGIALANSGLGAAHGFAAGLGANRSISHGLACAIMLPHVMRFNIAASPDRYAVIGQQINSRMYSDKTEAALAGAEYIEYMNKKMGIPANLKELKISKDEVPVIAAASMGGSMSGNPVKFDTASAAEFLLRFI